MKQIGRYEIIKELGQGAMGAVYKARDSMMDRVVAVKTILASALSGPMASDYRERFFREARAAGRLAHPGIVTMFDVSEEAGTPFIVMEFIEGQSLEKVLESGERFDPERVMEMGQQIAEALDFAHRAGVVHRDIKPANIMVTSEGRFKVTDFGVAKLTAAQMTSTGQLMGTPAFMAPEQFTGAPIDGRADLFALGVMMYWLATGDRPFTGETLTAMSYKVVHTEPVPPRKINPAIPRDLENIILKCMEKDPAARYLNGETLARDLRAVREGRSLDTLSRERAARGMEKTELAGTQPMPSENAAEDLDTAETVAVLQPKARSGGTAASGQRRPQPVLASTSGASKQAAWKIWMMVAALVIVVVGVTAVMKRREAATVVPSSATQQNTAAPQGGNPPAGGILPAPPDASKVQEDVAKAAKIAEESKKESARIAAESKKQSAGQMSSGLKLEFSATERANVVLTEEGKPPAAYQLQPGTSVTAAAENEVRMVTDNAAAIHWKLNGKQQAPLGTERKGVSVRITAAGAEQLWTGNPAQMPTKPGLGIWKPGGVQVKPELGAIRVPNLSNVPEAVKQELKGKFVRLKVEMRAVPSVLEVLVMMDGKLLLQRDAVSDPSQRVAEEALMVPPGSHEFEVQLLRRETRGRWTKSAIGDFVLGQPRVLVIRMVRMGAKPGGGFPSQLEVELR